MFENKLLLKLIALIFPFWKFAYVCVLFEKFFLFRFMKLCTNGLTHSVECTRNSAIHLNGIFLKCNLKFPNWPKLWCFHNYIKLSVSHADILWILHQTQKKKTEKNNNNCICTENVWLFFGLYPSGKVHCIYFSVFFRRGISTIYRLLFNVFT